MNQVTSLLYGSLEAAKYLDPRSIPFRRLAGLSEPLPPKIVKMDTLFDLVRSSRHIIRLAAIFGTSAVILGAYGAHTLMSKKGSEYDEAKKVFDTANRYHFYHSITLLAVPLSRYPKITALFMTMGMILFCGPCYLQSLMGDTRFRQVTPFGGLSLILAWMTLLF